MDLLRRIAPASSFADGPFRIVIRIHPFKIAPSIWEIAFSKDRFDWTNWCTCSAIDALHWIDKEHRDGSKVWLIPCRMDALNRADINARSIFYPDARSCNDIRHGPLSIQFGEGSYAVEQREVNELLHPCTSWLPDSCARQLRGQTRKFDQPN